MPCAACQSSTVKPPLSTTDALMIATLGFQARLGRLEIDAAGTDHLGAERRHESCHAICNVVAAFPDEDLKRFVRPAIGFHVVASLSVDELDGVAAEREEFDVGVAELDAEGAEQR